MPDLDYPYDIQPDDDATAEVIMAMFNAVKALLNSTGLDGSNVDASPSEAIPYSALDLSGSVDNGDLAPEAATYDKIATPSITTATNLSAFTDGSIILGTQTKIAEATAPSTAVYLVIARVQARNPNSINADSALTCDIKVDGAASWSEDRDWFMSTTLANDLRAGFQAVFPAVIDSGDKVGIYLTDASSSHTRVAAGEGVVQLVRIAAA